MSENILTVDGLTAENDSLRFKIARLEQKIKYYKELFDEIKPVGIELSKRGWDLLDLLSDLDKHGE